MNIENKHIEQCTAEEVIGAVMNTYSDIAERPIYKKLDRYEELLNGFLSRSVIYDTDSGNLSIENVQITIR